MTGKYQRSGPTEGRIATTADETEESWARRNTEQNWAILDRVRTLAETHRATPSQIAIAWLLHQPVVASVLLGVRTMNQLRDNLGAVSINLSSEALEELNQLSQLPELYPYRMIEAYAQRSLN